MPSLLRITVHELLTMSPGDLSKKLTENMWHQTHRRPSAGEVKSWENSGQVLAADLLHAERPGVEVLVEYQLPFCNKRADAVLAGRDRRTGRNKYVVVELKQWSEAQRFEDSDNLVRIAAYGSRAVTHPAEQVAGYCEYLTDFTASLADNPGAVEGVVYLHNATDLGVADLLDPSAPKGRIFTGQHRAHFVKYLQETFADESGMEAADDLLSSKITPSKQLMALAADEVQHREQFVLLDEQRDAFNLVRHAVAKAQRSNTKTAVIVSGGPGTGKSVIALSLMGELARQGRTVVHATGSRSFTLTLRQVAAKGSSRVKKSFQYFNSFISSEPNDLDCLILDEAHRIRENSMTRFTPKKYRSARPQIDELLSAARVPVFLLDENQVVRPGEMGNAADIEAAARDRGMDVIRIDLDSQFRCGGSQAYVDWVETLLGLRGEGPVAWNPDGRFEVRLADSPAAMEAFLASRVAEGFGARMAAGFCWPWSEPRSDGSLVPDVKIDGWERPWNLKGERSIGGAPPSALWATDPGGFGQVGCVYTAQGFEYDHAGIIIGPDFVWRTDRWVARREFSSDPELKNSKKVPDADFDRLVRNVYKVLLTRGLMSATLYSTDAETQEFLRSLTAHEAILTPVGMESV